MSHNSFGHLFRITTWGESHGPAIGCVVDGCPPGIQLDIADIQTYLDKRKPGQSRFTTQRKEPDQVRILSGVFTDEASGEQVTTGTPIALEIENVDARSKDYGDIKDKFRPGHADYTYLVKYGVRDWRGSGRASARETASRVAAGAIARKVVPGMRVRGALVQVGPHAIDRRTWDWSEVERNPFFCPDAKAVKKWADFLDKVRKDGSSVRRHHRDRGGRRTGRARRADLRQARPGHRQRADEHQCGEGRRDRRRLCRRLRCRARRMPMRCASAATARLSF